MGSLIWFVNLYISKEKSVIFDKNNIKSQDGALQARVFPCLFHTNLFLEPWKKKNLYLGVGVETDGNVKISVEVERKTRFVSLVYSKLLLHSRVFSTFSFLTQKFCLKIIKNWQKNEFLFEMY